MADEDAECAECGTDVDPDGAIWGLSGLEVADDQEGTAEDRTRLEPAMNDGPYCSMDCMLESGA